MKSCGAPENVWAQYFARYSGQLFQPGNVIDRNLSPLRGRPTTKTEGAGHGDHAAELCSGFEDDRIAFSHDTIYSTAKQGVSSTAVPTIPGRVGQLGMSTALGEMIKRARTASGKTQEEVADHIGLTKSAVSQWETGETIPELESFVAFCVYTNASADDLLLHRDMDELLKQLVGIWKNLSSDGRDSLLGNANRILTKERPEPGPHNPFPRKPSPNQTNSKAVKKRR